MTRRRPTSTPVRFSLLVALAGVAAAPPPAHSSPLPVPAAAQDDTTWTALTGARVTVYHAPGGGALGERVLVFLETQPPLPAIAADAPSGVSAYLAPDAESFDRLTGGAVPDWSAGVAIPSLARIVIPVYAARSALQGEGVRVLRHEWAHIGLHQELGELRVPRWFDEGYAQWASSWDRDQVWQLRLLLALGRAPPLDSLSLDWPRDATSARAAYLLSATAVEYLVSESGERSLALMLERWKAGGSLDRALRSTYGVTQGQLEEHWRAYVKKRYGWAIVVTQSMVLWSVIGVLLLLLLGVRRRRERERMARLRATEPSDSPPYWSGSEESSSGGAE